MNDSQRTPPSSDGDRSRSADAVGQLVVRLKVEQRAGWQRGERVLVEAYLEQHPKLRAEADGIVDLLYNEFLLREKAGESPRLEDYLVRFPHLAGKLRDQFEVHGALQSEQASDAASSEIKTITSAVIDPSLLADALPAIRGYELFGELGRGGMGVVYKAHQISLKRLVALKMILAGAHASPQDLARFRREAEAVARVQHPNIVQIYEVGTHNGQPFFSLEFVSGGGLDRKLNGTPQPARDAARLVETLARAMHVAHQRGIIHRDLKPSNVLLAEDGTPKITDFGLAKQLDSDVRQTQSGAIVGTPSYMAPEQAGGKNKEIGPACDVYALGAILYELLTGRPPFRAETPLDTVLQVISEEPVPPRLLNRTVPRDLETLCLKCLAKEATRRYRSAREMAEDLRRFLNGEPIHARAVGNLERCWRWCRRKPLVAGLGAMAALLFVLVLIVGPGAYVTTSLALRSEARQRREAENLLAETYLDRGLALCEQGEVQSGMMWLGRSLEQAPREAGDLQRAVRINLSAWRPYLTELWATLEFQRIEAHAFSPDGTKIATVAEDKSVHLWDLRTGRPFGKPLQHLGHFGTDPSCRVHLHSFSPDGKFLLTSGVVMGISRWDVARGYIGPIRILPKDPRGVAQGNVLAGGFSPDAQAIMCIYWGGGPYFVHRWDTVTGTPLGEPFEAPVSGARHGVLSPHGFAISPDFKTVVTSTGEVACLWDTTTGKRIGEPVRHDEGGAISAAFSAEGKTLVIACGSIARIWDAATAKPLGNPLRHDAWVKAVALSSDGSRLLTGSQNGTARLWDTATGKVIGQPLQHRNELWDVGFSRDGRIILTASSREVCQWKVASSEHDNNALPHRGPVRAMAFSSDGKRVVTASGKPGTKAWGEAQIWEVATGKPIGGPLHHKRPVFGVAFNPDGTRVLTQEGTSDFSPDKANAAHIWDATTGKHVGDAMQHPYFTKAIYSPQGTTILTRTPAGFGNEFRLWDAMTGKPITAPIPCFHYAAAFSPDGKWIATSGVTHSKQPGNGVDFCDLRLWDAATGKPVGQPGKLKEAGWALAFSPDGTRILTGSGDNTAQIWDAASLKPIGSPLQHQSPVMHVGFSRNGKFILTASGKTVRLWDANTVQPISRPLEHRADVLEADLSHDGTIIATRSADGEGRLWDVATGLPIGPPLHQWGSVTAIAFSPDGQTLIAASDKSARLSRLPTPVEGTPDRITLWLQVGTGMEIDEHRAVRILDAQAWQERRQRLQKKGGPPTVAEVPFAWEQRGDLYGAIEAYRNAIELDPKDAEAHYNLGSALRDQGDRSGAIAAYRKAIDLDPTNAKAYHGLGNALRTKGDIPNAIAAYRKAIDLDPESAITHSNLGIALYDRGDLAGAIAAYRKAIELDPNYSTAYYNLGIALRDQADVPGAISAYQKAIDLNPAYAEAHCNLGQVLRSQGKLAESLAAYQRGHELGSKQKSWRYPSAQWVKGAERLVELDAQLSDVLDGKQPLTDAAERIEYARVCKYKRLFVASARFYREVFAEQSTLIDDLRAGHRYHAACCAALAGAGQGEDAGNLTAEEHARWRQQALEWLRTELAARIQLFDGGKPEDRSRVEKGLRPWQADRDLAGVRDEAALAKLPPAEREAWQKLWADVAALLERSDGK